MISSKANLKQALETLAELDQEIENRIGALRAQRDKLKESIDAYVIDKYEAGDGYEDDTFLATKVVGFMRNWSAEKLEKLMPRGLFKQVVKLSIDNAKLDQLVKAGKIDREMIEPAFEEAPKKPYVKVTRKSNNTGRASAEAEGLAAKLQ